MSLTYKRQPRHVEDQPVAPFTGEGAYHGSTKARPRKPAPQEEVVAEMRPTTLAAYRGRSPGEIERFQAVFPNLYRVERTLPVPSQEEIRADGTTLCWCPLDQALEVAGPTTRRVVEAMRELLVGDKRYAYVDSKIQYFRPGDVPVDSQHWHVDGSIVARGPEVEALGHTLLHDMRARWDAAVPPPRYLAYQSSEHCATLFLKDPLTLDLPEMIPNFDGLDAAVRQAAPAVVPHPASAIVRTDGLSLHRAQAASGEGWRLWIRCVETDRKVELNRAIIDCYATIFRT